MKLTSAKPIFKILIAPAKKNALSSDSATFPNSARPLLVYLLVLASLFFFKSNSASAQEAAENNPSLTQIMLPTEGDSFVFCQKDSQARLIAHLWKKGYYHVNYHKLGEIINHGKFQNHESSFAVVENIKSNLEKMGWKCRLADMESP